ncbi:ABC transporter permease [Telmatobacter sp. DSM 110680]|uniref:ABC transporter permease n=1 Tax=Telmatobacter sp. DSM 110680 TaxID=3036704 RepID=A0AAU7DQN9_9BACT
MFGRDLRFTMRQLRRAPGFTLTVALTLALGIGSATAVYSIVDAVLLRPLPFPRADRLVELDNRETLVGGASRSNDVSYPNFFDWRSQTKSFQSLSSYKTNGFTLGGRDGEPATRTTGVLVSSEFFSTVGVAPILGRGFQREEEQAGNRSVVIGFGLWKSLFNSSPSALGKVIRLDEKPYTVVGVMPAGFQFPIATPDAQIWVTLAQDAEGAHSSASQRGYNQLDVVGRLRDGVSIDQARAEMNTIQRGLALHYPDDDKEYTSVDITSELNTVVGDARKPLQLLFAAVGVLLLIACANAAGLLLTRSNGRVSELSIRAALGASRAMVLRQLMLESSVLSLCGGGLGVALVTAVLRVAPRFLPVDLVRSQTIALNVQVLAFALGISLVTGLVFGVLPALRMSRLQPASALRASMRSATAGRRQHLLHSGLIVTQTALSLVLLTGAGLLMRSFDQILRVDPGFDPSHLLTFRVAVPESRYDGNQQVAFFHRLESRLEMVPGVQSAAAGFPLPLSGGNIRISFSIIGQPVATGDEPSERVSLIDRRFFETLRIPIKQGRFFLAAEHESEGQPVVLINEAFAQKYFPGQNPVGQHMRSGLGAGDPPPIREIVGVVGDVKRASLTEQELPEYYIPIEQAPVAPPPVAVRVSGDPASYENAVRSAVAEIDPALPVYRLHPYADDLSRITARQRFQAVLITAFAATAMFLAAVGLYSLLGFIVNQRTSELGLRFALGAQRSSVLLLILRHGVALSTTGLALGLAASLMLTRFLGGMLFHVKPFDPLTFASVSMLLLAVVTLASLVPAYFASKIDPIETLRML